MGSANVGRAVSGMLSERWVWRLPEGLDQATVDEEVASGDVVRAIAGQEQDEVGYLLRVGESSGGGVRGPRGPSARRSSTYRIELSGPATASPMVPDRSPRSDTVVTVSP